MRLPPSLPRPKWVRKGSDTKQTLVPDGLQHPKFTARKSDKSNYLLCNRASVAILTEYGGSKRRAGTNIYPLLADHIAHLLRLRVLQELELLADKLQTLLNKPKQLQPKLNSRVIRRLTRAEWNNLRTEGIVPYPNAIAIIVLPPLRKDPITKQPPKPSMSAAPLVPDPATPKPRPFSLPLCTMHPVVPYPWARGQCEGILPAAQVPLYNGVALFPLPSQRAALHALLTRLLGFERASRHEVNARDDTRASHAFLLTSDVESVLRGDVAAVAIALWRVKMFEDAEEDVASQSTLGWEHSRR
ncbi:hypothetical protein H0H81_006114 [Sphagnurus paluster]|uniref:Uncharacterized protein n=1 Tax=Sphagnurus paluster TaxID=117069 RepID=A0A9P7FRJ2_9AGAR|nr:hypothetical protein H0H81_006114 [Sphagnurus paluster]